MERSRYAVGLDVGTHTIRAVVGHIDDTTNSPTIIGVASEPSNGVRKGIVVNLVSVAQAIDKALESAERMSGHQINSATISINGSHITGIGSKGVVAVNNAHKEITAEDVDRAQDAATVVQLPANREILEVTPRSYQLDGQDNIKDPIGMSGVRLEVDAHVITALTPHVKNLQKTCEMTHTAISNMIPAPLAAARSCLSDQLLENGVAIIDIGGATTSIAVFDEGDLQHVGIIPIGSNNITKDLAIGLKTDLDVAEAVKLEHAHAHPADRKSKSDTATVSVDGAKHEFSMTDVDEIVEARLEDLFEHINAELARVGRKAKLPAGAVLCGGGALLAGIKEFAKEAMQLSVRIGKPSEFAGMGDKITSPEFAVAAGLMQIDMEESAGISGKLSSEQKNGSMFDGLGKKASGLLGRFKL